jgi:hypothetical protein
MLRPATPKQGEPQFSPALKKNTKDSVREKALKGAAREAEQMVEQEGRERDEHDNDDGRGQGMSRSHLGQPHG